MKNLILSPLVVCLSFILFFAGSTSADAQTNNGLLITVNDTADTHDADAGDRVCADSFGKCTLRAAVEEANSTPAPDAIMFALPAPSTIDLTLGELTLSTNIYIAGPGARQLTVQRSQAANTPQFRLFRVLETKNNSPVPTTIRGLTLKNGNTTSDGGAFFVDYSASLRVIDSVIIGNTAAGSGGGIYCAGLLSLSRSLVASNTANGLYAGGVVNVNPGTYSRIINSTLTNNTGDQGGAIYNSGNLTLINATISHNTALTSGSSVLNGSGGTVNVLNTIIGKDNTLVSSLSGAFTSLGNNLVTDARNSSGFVNGTNGDQVSDNNAINPLLGNLADNGGQTDTRALLAGSPAIDHGNNCIRNASCPAPAPYGVRLLTDQRRRSRLGGTVDVGAYESGGGTLSGGGTFYSAVFGGQNRLGGSLVVLTHADTGEKQYRTLMPFGGYGFTNINFESAVFIEIRSKRAGFSSFTILDFDALLSGNFADQFEQNGVKFTLKR